ncbi:MAG: formylglycine-generating enzyme family protein [Planctomycetota bacterium]
MLSPSAPTGGSKSSSSTAEIGGPIQAGQKSAGRRSAAVSGLLPGLAILALSAASCDETSEQSGRLARAERYGIFHDLVLFAGLTPDGGSFFLDRFETSQADWRAYRLHLGEANAEIDDELSRYSVLDATLPVTTVSLGEARAYAAWRFGRLPRYEEWYAASTGGGRYLMPWGNQTRPWANSWELKLGFLTPVGTFESGRQGDGPYDLVGNAAEWTESVARERLSGLRGTQQVTASLALRVWSLGDGLPSPAFWVLQGEESPSEAVSRIVVGGMDRRMHSPAQSWELSGRNGRSSRVGIRVAADPEGIILALLAEQSAPDPAEERVLRAFLSRPEHRRVLRAVYLRRPELSAVSGPLAGILQSELDP